MKTLRSVIGFLLIIIIIGGVGYLAWNFWGMSGNMQGMNMSSNVSNIANSTDTTNNTQTDSSVHSTTEIKNNLNTQVLQSKDKLSQVITTINDSINQITIDPYSKVTLPEPKVSPSTSQPQGGGTTVNVYPNAGSQTNVPPTTGATTNGNTNISNTVYDQLKLEQLHNGIFKLAQGMMLLNELNDDLTVQSTASEATDYNNLSSRYKLLEQDSYKLNRGLSFINEASSLININPYTSSNGYSYDIQKMEQFHKGIYKLAQGMVSGVKLRDDFSNQMASINSYLSTNSNNSMNNMNMGSILNIGSMNFSTIMSIILIVFVIIFLLALYGAIKSMFKSVTKQPIDDGLNKGGKK